MTETGKVPETVEMLKVPAAPGRETKAESLDEIVDIMIGNDCKGQIV